MAALAMSARPAAQYAARLAVLALVVVLVAVATVLKPQLGCAVALVLAVLAAYAGRPAAGLTALWAVWLTAPALRRLFGWKVGYEGQDPLAAVPFVATVAVAAVVLLRHRPARAVRNVLLAAGAGLALGLPVGASSPNAAAFALLAYGGALSGLVLGWRDGARGLAASSLVRVLAVAAPLLALYALLQYFVQLPAWDQRWLDTVDFTSVGAPEAGKIRSFASLNSPGLLGTILALTLVLGAVRRRRPALLTALAAVVALGLAVTYVRSAWVALAVGALVLLAASRGRAAPGVGRLVLVLALGALVLTANGSTFTAFSQRVTSLGSTGTDISAQARQDTPLQLLPVIAGRPLGFGLGSAGEAARLNQRGGFVATDNGYLSMAYQLGFPGALLVIGAFVGAVAFTLRRLFARRDPERAVFAALFAFLLVGLAAGDLFYGFAGVVLWYFAGAGLARATSAPNLDHA